MVGMFFQELTKLLVEHHALALCAGLLDDIT
jgi:hypothetical protein